VDRSEVSCQDEVVWRTKSW